MSENDIREIRRDQLQAYILRVGSQVEAAEALEVTPGYLSQIISGHRNMGEKAARKLEAAANLPDGYFDSTETSETNLSPDEQRLVSRFRFLTPEQQEHVLGYLAYQKSITFKGDPARKAKVQREISAPQVHDKKGDYDKSKK